MKTGLLSLAFLAVSLPSFAAYKCDFELSREGKIVSSPSISANNGTMSGGYQGTLFVEIQKGDLYKKPSKWEEMKLEIGGMINGWNEEDGGQIAKITIYRTHKGATKDRFVSLPGDGQILIDGVEFQGETFRELSFEDYNLKISCGKAEDQYGPFII